MKLRYQLTKSGASDSSKSFFHLPRGSGVASDDRGKSERPIPMGFAFFVAYALWASAATSH